MLGEQDVCGEQDDGDHFKLFDVAASVTIPRRFITSWDVDFGDSVGFFSGVSPISSINTSNISPCSYL